MHAARRAGHCNDRATEELLTNKALEADFVNLQGRVQAVMKAFDQAKKVRVTTLKGTDLSFRIDGRTSHCCKGTCLDPGTMAAVPDMEVYIAPIENTMAGTLIADVMGTGMGLLTQPIHLEIKTEKPTGLLAALKLITCGKRLKMYQEAPLWRNLLSA